MNFRIFVRKYLPNGTLSYERCIQDGYSGLKEYTLIDPKLTKSKSAAGSFECSFHSGSAIFEEKAPDGNSWIERSKTRIVIRRYTDPFKTGKKIWEGRVLNCELDFYKQQHIYAEGALSYLNDSTQELKIYEYGENSGTETNKYPKPGLILNDILERHNEKCPDKIIKYKETNASPSWPKTDYLAEKPSISEFVVGNQTTMSAVSKMLSTFGGNVRLVYGDDDVAYLEWYTSNAMKMVWDEDKKEWVQDKSGAIPKVVFTENLLDITQKRDATNLVTTVFPRGYVAYSAGSDAIGDDMFKPKDDGDVSPLNWNKASYFHNISLTETDIRGCGYEWVWDGVSDHGTASTGFAYSDLAHLDPPDGLGWDYPPGSAPLEVKEGEVYYISLVQSDGRACYAITARYLGTNPAWVIATTNATSGSHWPEDTSIDGTVNTPTTWNYNKITIPALPDSLKAIDPNMPMYLNISSRGTFGTDNTYSGKGPMGIWKGRKIPEGVDECITLKGLGDGTYSKFFYTDTTTNVQVVLEMTDQSSKDRDIYYPKSSDIEENRKVNTYADLPSSVQDFKQYYVISENAHYWKRDGGDWEKCEVNTADDLTALWFGDSGTTFWVKDKEEWWVRVTGNNSTTGEDISNWYKQKKFTRSGYYITMDELVTDYGRIEKIIDYNTVIDPDQLENLGLNYLYNAYFEDLSINIQAVDMTILNPELDPNLMLDTLDPVQVVSSYHGINAVFYINDIEIPFNDLGSTTFDIGYDTSNRITK